MHSIVPVSYKLLTTICSDYDLVRSHHPDSPHCRSLPSDMAHSRFSAIIKAYEILRNPHLHSPHSSRYPHPRHPRANHHPHYSYYAYDPDVWTAEMNRRRAEWRRNQEVWGRYHSYANANGARAGMGAEEEVQWERNGKNAKGFDGMKDPVVMGLGLGVCPSSFCLVETCIDLILCTGLFGCRSFLSSHRLSYSVPLL